MTKAEMAFSVASIWPSSRALGSEMVWAEGRRVRRGAHEAGKVGGIDTLAPVGDDDLDLVGKLLHPQPHPAAFRGKADGVLYQIEQHRAQAALVRQDQGQFTPARDRHGHAAGGDLVA